MSKRAEFLKLFLRIQGDLYAYILSRGIDPSVTEDVLQDAAVVIWEKFESFQPGTDFRAWALAITRFEVLKTRRSAIRRGLQLDAETLDRLEVLVREQPEPSTRLMGPLQRCLGRLSEAARQLLYSRYRNGRSVEDIAAALGRPVGSVHVSLSRIRQFLHECVRQGLRLEDPHA